MSFDREVNHESMCEAYNDQGIQAISHRLTMPHHIMLWATRLEAEFRDCINQCLPNSFWQTDDRSEGWIAIQFDS